MYSLKAAASVMVMTLFASALLLHVSQASVVRPYRSQRSENAAGEIIRRASEIIKLAEYSQDWSDVSKRNPGTADTLYNLPMLEKIGRRR